IRDDLVTGVQTCALPISDWVSEHGNDSNVVVAEVDENPALYDEGHISGAIRLHWRDDLQDPIERDLIERDDFEKLMGGLGISNSSEERRVGEGGSSLLDV